MSRRGAHQKLVEASATIALIVSQTKSGAAHTVQLMLRDPKFRETAIQEAWARSNTSENVSPTDAQRAAEQDVRSAARELRAYAGVVL